MTIEALARKWCYAPHGDWPCKMCDAIAAAVREALVMTRPCYCCAAERINKFNDEEAQGMDPTCRPECGCCEAAIAALRGGTG